MKVLLTTNCPTPYINGFADELGKLCDLTLVYEMKLAKDRDLSWLMKDGDKWHFKLIFLNGIPFSVETALSFKIKKIIKKGNFDKIIIANPTTPTGIVAELYCRRHKIPYIIQSEGGFQGSGKGLKEKFKKYIMEKATMYLTGMGGDNDYFLMYGATKDKLRPYKFASQYSSEIMEKPLSDEDKVELRKKLGLSGKKTILYAGRFIECKGIDNLLKAFKGLDDKYQLLLIGGVLEKKYRDIIDELKISNVTIIEEFISKEKLMDYFKASDLYIMMTKGDTWGLVINESMSYGLPVITTTACVAGVCLIEEGVNGFLVDPYDFNSARERIDCILANDKLRHSMACSNIEKVKGYTLENMASTIYRYLEEEK